MVQNACRTDVFTVGRILCYSDLKTIHVGGIPTTCKGVVPYSYIWLNWHRNCGTKGYNPTSVLTKRDNLASLATTIELGATTAIGSTANGCVKRPHVIQCNLNCTISIVPLIHKAASLYRMHTL